jgi:hypothetical protein
VAVAGGEVLAVGVAVGAAELAGGVPVGEAGAITVAVAVGPGDPAGDEGTGAELVAATGVAPVLLPLQKASRNTTSRTIPPRTHHSNNRRLRPS